MSSSRQEKIIEKGFIKSLLEGKLELKDLAGINPDLDVARQAYIQGVMEATQALIDSVAENMATSIKQDLIVSRLLTVASAVAAGTNTLDDDLLKIKYEGIDVVDLSDGEDVADSGGTDTQESYADVGYINEILGAMYYAAAPIGATGAPNTHYAQIRASGGLGLKLLKISSYGDDELEYNYGEVISATHERFPALDSLALQNIRGYRYDEDTGIGVVYVNSTNATKTGTRFCRLWVRKLRVA